MVPWGGLWYRTGGMVDMLSNLIGDCRVTVDLFRFFIRAQDPQCGNRTSGIGHPAKDNARVRIECNDGPIYSTFPKEEVWPNANETLGDSLYRRRGFHGRTDRTAVC